jgi:hypothetical protein
MFPPVVKLSDLRDYVGLTFMLSPSIRNGKEGGCHAQIHHRAEFPSLTEHELVKAAKSSRSGLKEMKGQIQWMQSFVTPERPIRLALPHRQKKSMLIPRRRGFHATKSL